MLKFVGWIPTVNGRLSYRHIGDSRHPTETQFANLELPSGRIVLAIQRRPLSDILFPRLLHRLSRRNGDFWFVLTARANAGALQADRLGGSIHIFKTADDWRSVAGRISENIAEIERQRYAQTPDREALAVLAFDRAGGVCDVSADVRVDFTLDRDGEASFDVPHFKEAALERASTSFARGSGHDISKWISDQAYFFLRDVSHTHQHHKPDTDTILILQEHDALDIQWRKNVFYSLNYAVIRFKRHADAVSSTRAMGIVAYCNSFVACCERRNPDFRSTLELFNDRALLQSLQAKSDEMMIEEQLSTNQLNTSLARASNIRTIVVGFAAIAIAVMAMLVQPHISANESERFPALYEASLLASEHAFTFVMFSLLFVTFSVLATRTKWLTRRSLPRAVLEATYIQARPAIVWLLLLAVFAAGLSLWIFRAATLDLIAAVRALWSFSSNLRN